MIKKSELIEGIVDHLGPFLNDHGFAWVKSDGDFVRKLRSKQDRLAPEAFRWRQAPWHVTFRAKIRFGDLEVSCARYDPGVPSKPDRSACAVNQLVEGLYPKGIGDYRWRVDSEEDVAAAIPQMRQRLSDYALPFLDSLPDLEALAARLKEPGGLWPVPGGLKRALYLLTSLALLGDSEEFRRWQIELEREMEKRDEVTRERFDGFQAALLEEHSDLAPT